MNQAVVDVEAADGEPPDGGPEDAALGFQLCSVIHRLRRELVEGDQVLQHAHRLVERAEAAECTRTKLEFEAMH